jgi:hypothetical protein
MATEPQPPGGSKPPSDPAGTTSPQVAKPYDQLTLRERVHEVFKDTIPDILTTVMVILGLAAGKYLLEWLVGKDEKFFDVIPVKWVFDVGDITNILVFVGKTWKRFLRA